MKSGEELYKYVEKRLKQELQSRQMRLTGERKQMLEFMVQSKANVFSIAALMDMAKAQNITYNTVKDFICLMEELGMVMPVNNVGKTFLGSNYQLMIDSRSKENIVEICDICGKQIQTKSVHVRRALKTIYFPKFKPTHYTMYIHGICQGCAKDIKQKQNKTT
jgi:Fe2+ or Zn2+ uptake regulation protein